MAINLCEAIHTENNLKMIVYLIMEEGNLIEIQCSYSNEDKHIENIIDRMLEPVGIYQHFKGGIYRTFCIAKNNESNENFIVYQNISPEQKDKYLKIYARPLDLFFSEVDRKKHPNVKQKYRFKKIKGDEL